MANNKINFTIDVRDAGSGAFRSIVIAAEDADEAISRIAQSAERAGNSLRGMAAKSLTVASATQALGTLKNMVGGLVAPYDSFEMSMRQANTMAAKNGTAFRALKEDVANLGKEIPLVREELANGLYQVVSNGVPQDNWIDFLRDSAKAAVGGCADLGQTITVTSTIIKNYGLEWSTAGAIQDKIQTTAKNGVTNFEQLSQALPKVTGSAAQLGVQLDELMATFATTTGVTGNTAEVSTQLAAVLNSLIKPSSEAQKAADAMGIKFDAASVRACGGFRNFLTELDAAVAEYAASSGQLSETIYGQLFGSAEALRILGSLTGEQKDTFANNIKAMSDSAGTIGTAFEEMASTGTSAMTRLQNKMSGLMDAGGKIASAVAPYLEVAANAGIAVGSIIQLTTAVKALDIAARAAAVGQTVVAVATKAWTVVQAALNVVLTNNPIGIAIKAIAVLVAGIIYAYNHSESFRRVCDQVWSVIKKLAKTVWDTLVKAFDAITGAVKKAWDWVKRFLGLSGSNTSQIAAGMTRLGQSAHSLSGETEKATASGLKAAAAANWQKMSYAQLGEEIERQKTKVAQLAGVNSISAKAEADRLRQMEARYKALGRQFGLSESGKGLDGSSLVVDPHSLQELSNNLQYYEKRLQTLNPAEKNETKNLIENIEALKAKKDELEALHKSYAAARSTASISDLDKAIDAKRTEINLAINNESRIRLQRELEALESKKTRLEIILEAKPIKPKDILPSINGVGWQLDLSKIKIRKNENGRRIIEGLIPDLSKEIDKINKSGKLKDIVDDDTPRRIQNITASFNKANIAITSMSSVMGSLSSAVGESAGAWLDWGANLLSTVSQALPALQALAIANTLGHGAGAGPFGWIQAIAGVAAITAAFLSIPKFANGGIAYGPTLGLFGEYAGARNNPEVVAPLNKLRELIRPQREGGYEAGPIEFFIDGRKLRAVMQRVERYNSRTQ